MSIDAQRQQVRQLVDESSPVEAPTAYYALFHDPARSVLFLDHDEMGRAVGFAGRFQTGIDLFRPLATLQCRNATSAAALLAQALMIGRPYIFFAPLSQLPLVGGSLQIDNLRVLHLYRLNAGRFQPVINVLVQQRESPGGLPRCVIESGGQKAVAGVNWQSPRFAEIYVHTDPAARGRGWGFSVASALTQAVLESGRIPVYLVDQDNDVSRQLAEKLGYEDAGAQYVYADAVYLGHP